MKLCTLRTITTILCAETLTGCFGESCRQNDVVGFRSALQSGSKQLQYIGLTAFYQQPKLLLSLMAQLRTHFLGESPEVAE